MTDDNDKDDPFSPRYKVGYGRPPIANRFQKGQSGNPMGRPKTPAAGRQKLHPDMRDQILEIAERQFQTSDGQKSGLRIVAEAEFRSATKGHPHAQKNYLDRVTQAYAEREADVLENHAYWRDHIEKYWAREKAGLPIPEHWVHPDELVFEKGKFVGFIGGDPKIAALNRAFKIGLRDIMILKAGLDYRAVDRDQCDKILQSEVLAFACNSALPGRFQLSEIVLILRLRRAECTSKRMLIRQIRIACDELDLPDITKIPAFTVTLADIRMAVVHL